MTIDTRLIKELNFRQHPLDYINLSYQGEPIDHRICDGEIVHL